MLGFVSQIQLVKRKDQLLCAFLNNLMFHQEASLETIKMKNFIALTTNGLSLLVGPVSAILSQRAINSIYIWRNKWFGKYFGDERAKKIPEISWSL